MPWTVSRVVSADLDSSTVMTPSFPTASMASAMIFPMVASLLADMVATCSISFLPDTGMESFFISFTTVSTALSIPLLMSMGFAPDAIALKPSLKMA